MNRLYASGLAMAATLAVVTGAHAAEIGIPYSGKPKELSVYVNQPNCQRWTDDCVNCARGASGEAPTCSNIGVACQPKAIRCTAADIPQGEPQKK